MENRFEKIVKDIFSFAQFVSEVENEIPNQSSRYYDCWWELEVLNASALEDWEISGKPEKWEKWTEKYQTEALQSVKNLFAEEVPENNIVCDISHFCILPIGQKPTFPINHVYMPNIGGKWKRSKCRF